ATIHTHTLSLHDALPISGRWKTIDDETGKVKSIVEISESSGKLRGQVVEILHSDRGPDPVCDKCKGSNKDKPVKGMTILWDLQRSEEHTSELQSRENLVC